MYMLNTIKYNISILSKVNISKCNIRQNYVILSSSKRTFNSSSTKTSKEITINFIGKRDEIIKANAYIGESLLDVSQRNGLDVEGVCEGSMACSTCHMIFDVNLYNKIPRITEEELDTLDLAPEVTTTSRLGCQVIVTEDFNDATIKLPKHTANALD